MHFPERADPLVGSPQADAIRARLVTCERRTFLICSRPNEGTQALAEYPETGVSSAPPNIAKVYEVVPRLASVIKRALGKALE